MKKIIIGMIAGLFTVALSFATTDFSQAGQPNDHGFDDFGYNRTARNFVGTGAGWYQNKYGGSYEDAVEAMAPYGNDHLKMKWNSEWDRGNVENWSNPPYDAWEDNQWNGAFPDGSGEVYHFKTKWVGLPCDDTNPLWSERGYCIWGQFEVLSEHWTDSEGHIWGTHAVPSGYASHFSKPVLLETVVVDPSDLNGAESTVVLENSKKYLFQVSGTYSNKDGAEHADAEYVTEDNWVTKYDGLPGWPETDYWNLLDLQVNQGFVDWLELNPAVPNTYDYTMYGNGATVNFRVFDGTPETNVINPGWYTDNIGELTVEIYLLP